MVRQTVAQFDFDMNRIVSLLRDGDEAGARSIFNSEIFPRYEKILSTDTNNPLSRVILFFYDLDEFLNNPTAKSYGVSTRENIIGSYYSDYQKDLEQAFINERKYHPV